MNFLQPLFLAGLLAAALPIVIHLINRRKAVRRPFPALKLLRASNERIARSVKVRQWLLLALRVLAIAVLVAALAKPFVLSDDGATADDRLPTSVAFVVEDGVAMDYDDWFDEATDILDDEIDDLGPWDEAALLTTTAEAPVHADLTSEHGDIADAAGDLDQTHQTGDLAATLLEADDILAASELPNDRIVVIGSGTDTPVESRRELRLTSPVDYIDVSDGDEVDNLAVTDVDYEQQRSEEGAWTIDAVVTNFGSTDRSDVPLRLQIDGETVGATTVDVDAGESTAHSFDHHLEARDITEAAVEIEDDDGLQADNRYHFAIQPRDRARSLLINGSPSSVPYDDELFFLNRALEPLAEASDGFSISETTPDGLADRNLERYDVVVLANVSKLSSERADELVRFVEDGGGVFFAMGDQVDPDAYNEQFEQLLPRPLRNKKLLAERDDPDAPVKTTRIGHPRTDHPVFRDFDAPGAGVLQSVSVYSYMLLDPAPSERETDELLTFQDRAPALVERQVDQGRVLLWTTSIDRDWTDFPVRSAYLPLMNQSLRYLARRAGSDSQEHHVVGRQAEFNIADLLDERAVIHDPEGRRHVEQPVDGLVTFTPEVPGIHTFYADDEDDTALIESLTMAVNVDRDGSSFDDFPQPMLDDWAAADDEEVLEGAGGATEERRVNLWSYLLFVVVMVLLAETVVGVRRSVLLRTFDKLAFWRDDGDDDIQTL